MSEKQQNFHFPMHDYFYIWAQYMIIPYIGTNMEILITLYMRGMIYRSNYFQKFDGMRKRNVILRIQTR